MREDWIEVTLDEIIVENGVFKDGDWVESKDQDPNGDVRLIQLADIGDGVFLNKSDRFLTRNKAEELNCTFLKEGDIIIARMPHPLGRATIFPLKGDEKYITVVDVAIIRLENTNVLTKFILYNINSPNSRRKIEELQSGTTRKRISRKNLATITFPLAPPPEQRAIVAKIEELYSEVDNGIDNLKKAKEKLLIYRQAVLNKAFEGELTKDWREKQTQLQSAKELLDQIRKEREDYYEEQLKEWKKAVSEWEAKGKEGKKPTAIRKPNNVKANIEEDIEQYGYLPKGWMWTRFCNVTYKIGDVDHKMPRNFPGGIPYLSTGNLKSDGSIDFENAKTISLEDYDKLSLKIKPEKGDVIFPRYGTIGRNILVNIDKEFLVSYSCAIIKNIRKLMDERFVYYFSISPIIKKEINRYKVETTQANIGISSIENFVFPLCSKQEQMKIVQEIESRLSVCDNILVNIDEGLDKAEALRQSILKKAFEGKLLSKEELEACRREADWEPAEKLLERIKTEKK